MMVVVMVKKFCLVFMCRWIFSWTITFNFWPLVDETNVTFPQIKKSSRRRTVCTVASSANLHLQLIWKKSEIYSNWGFPINSWHGPSTSSFLMVVPAQKRSPTFPDPQMTSGRSLLAIIPWLPILIRNNTKTSSPLSDLFWISHFLKNWALS